MVNQRAQNFIDKLSTKAKELNLKINPDKTKAMLFQMSNKKLEIKINEMEIETVNVHRYLGLNFDRGFKFGAHVRETKRNAMDRMNMLKVISSNRTGGHPQTMGLIYNAIIRGYLDYGSSIYANASKTNLQALTVANNAGLRKVTGCTKTTPINTLCAIASQPPLEYRRELVAAKEIIRHVQFDSPVWDQLEKMELDDTQDKPPTYLESVFIKYKDVFQQVSRTVRVKDKVMIEVETEVDNWRKKTTSDRVLKQATLGLLASKYEKCTKIFTDASKIEDRCGIGVYDQTNNFMLKLKLQNTVCIMSAELEAIYVALQYLEKRQIYNAVILTDSKSGCELIRSQMDNNEQDEVIFSIIRKAAGMMTRIQWIPGHVNVQGNETADRLAKLGLDQTEAVVNKMFPHDAISRCKDAIMDEVQMCQNA
nr:uncharacterized protein LOC115268543 [Aedes albopictus]